MKTPAHVLPADIERSSMAIITKELEQRGIYIPEEQRAVVLRAIHTTADFDYAENLRFTEGAMTRSLAYLRAGSPVIITDANMSLAGISKPSLEKLGGSLYCFTGNPAIREAARKNGTTRAAAGIAYAADNYPDAVFVIGNAPTALFHLADRIGKGLRPARPPRATPCRRTRGCRRRKASRCLPARRSAAIRTTPLSISTVRLSAWRLSTTTAYPQAR